LGAEFIHGEENEIWELLPKVGLHAVRVTDQHWRFENGALIEEKHFWDKIARVSEQVDPGRDETFSSFLGRNTGFNEGTKTLVTDYVEGFNAADKDRISTKALTEGQNNKAFRIATGYSALVDWFVSELTGNKAATLHLGKIAKCVLWKRGQVEIDAMTQEGQQTFRAAKAIVTLPPSVLSSEGAGSLQFVPGLPAATTRAIAQLPVGDVVRILLKFRTKFWPMGDGFVHAPGTFLPVWWCVGANKTWTGWTGGPRAKRIAQLDDATIFFQATRVLCKFFDVNEQEIKENCEGRHYHDWTGDPFSCGAYSYLAAGALDARRDLAQPVDGTLFFAGEATASPGKEGTVHGAIASGLRAADEAGRT